MKEPPPLGEPHQKPSQRHQDDRGKDQINSVPSIPLHGPKPTIEPDPFQHSLQLGEQIDRMIGGQSPGGEGFNVHIQVIGPGRWIANMWRKHKSGTIITALFGACIAFAVYQVYSKGNASTNASSRPQKASESPQVSPLVPIANRDLVAPPTTKAVLDWSSYDVERVLAPSNRWMWVERGTSLDLGKKRWIANHGIYGDLQLFLFGSNTSLSEISAVLNVSKDTNDGAFTLRKEEICHVVSRFSLWSESEIGRWIDSNTSQNEWFRNRFELSKDRQRLFMKCCYVEDKGVLLLIGVQAVDPNAH